MPIQYSFLVDISSIPLERLRSRWLYSKFVHDSWDITRVFPTTMPNAMMKKNNGASRAYYTDLTTNILVSSNLRLMNGAQMRSRNIASSTHFCRHLMREIDDLNIKIFRPQINRRILMIGLYATSVWEGQVYMMMIKNGISSHQAFEGSCYSWVVKNFTDWMVDRK